MIYLDNAATTFPKPAGVIKEVNRCLRKYCGNPGRSSHKLSAVAAEEIYNVRERVSRHFGLDSPESVVFAQNGTYALNLAIKTLIPKDCHVLTTDYEHNSVIRPLETLRNEKGISYSAFSTEGNVEDNIIKSICGNTRALVCSLRSNVFDYSVSLDMLSNLAKKYGLLLIIDGSSIAGHQKIDLCKSKCDAFCCPGHKALFGIQGSGFAIFNDKIRKGSFVEGGSGSESESLYMPDLLPEGYEAGTLPTPAIVSLSPAIRFIDDVGLDEIGRKLECLALKAKEILDSYTDFKIYGSSNGVISFNYKNVPSHYFAEMLDKEEICVRGGLHCAPSAHKKAGTLSQGAVRLSFSYLNSQRSIDRLYRALKNILRSN